jgi:hypothetical protein
VQFFLGLPWRLGPAGILSSSHWFYFVRNRLCIERRWAADRAERNMHPRQAPLAMRRYLAIHD